LLHHPEEEALPQRGKEEEGEELSCIHIDFLGWMHIYIHVCICIVHGPLAESKIIIE
jgi:hypothetical protein